MPAHEHEPLRHADSPVGHLGGVPHKRRSRALGRISLVLVLALVVGAGVIGYRYVRDLVTSPGCTVTAGGVTESFDPEQSANSALISALSIKRGLPPRAATIALTTAFQESKILNITYGDRDSLGLFQQRPSQGWGTEEQILDPVYSTNKFYDALIKLKDYEHADITEVAQKVQRSGFPEAYRDHEGQGRVLASTLTGHSPRGLTCSLDPATKSAEPSQIVKDLEQQFGLTTARVEGPQVVATLKNRQLAWALAHWAVARADHYGLSKVSIGTVTWDRADGAAGWSDGTESLTVTLTPALTASSGQG